MDTIRTPAWKAMSPSARCIYIALRQRYSSNFKNNGKLYLSVRQAAKEVGVNKETAARGFREIQHYGFGVITSGPCLGVDGKGKAPHWRLTEVGYMADPPTRDFLHWDGTKFQEQKSKTLYGKSRHPVRKIQTLVSGKSGHLKSEVSGKSVHTNYRECPENPDITSLTTGAARAGSGLGGGVLENADPALEYGTEPSSGVDSVQNEIA
jgi:hypothetical protein